MPGLLPLTLAVSCDEILFIDDEDKDRLTVEYFRCSFSHIDRSDQGDMKPMTLFESLISVIDNNAFL